MVTVPTYRQTETLRPAFQQGITVQASPEAFGSGIGRGLKSVASGGMQLADSIQQVRDLEDTMRAKEADNAYAGWARERMFGENGFMTMQGKNAVDGRAAFEKEAAEKRKEFGQNLTGGASASYNQASEARLQSIYNQSIQHTAAARKQWFSDSSNARIETFASDALANYNNSAVVNKNLSAAILELREQGNMQGWDADTMKLREAQLVSGVSKDITLRLAQDDPLAAEKYMKDAGDRLSAADRMALNKSLKAPILAAKANRNFGDIIGGLAPETYEGEDTENEGAIFGNDLGDDADGGTVIDDTAAVPAPAKPVAAAPSRPTPVGPQSFQSVASQVSGLREGRDSAAIASFIKNSAGISINPNMTPWCAAFVNAVLGAQGVKGTGSLAAKSFLNFGTATDSPKPGDIVVLHRGSDPNKGHVGFFQGYDANGNILVFGGNQSNGVNTSSYSSDRVAGFRSAGVVDENTMRLPNYGPQGLGNITERLSAITDPQERAATMKLINSYYTAQKKQIDASREQAQSWAETQMITNPAFNPMTMPPEIRTAIGASGMTTLLNYQEKVRASGEPVTDDRTMYNLREQYADDPAAFGEIDLFQYRDKLSNKDWDTVNGWRQTARTDKRKAKEDGDNLSDVLKLADDQLTASGLLKSGSRYDEDNAKVKAEFSAAYSARADQFREQNNREPTAAEQQKIVNEMMLKKIMTVKGSGWLSDDTAGFSFQLPAGIGDMGGGTSVRLDIDYNAIPASDRIAIEARLRAKGETVSREKVSDIYRRYLTDTYYPAQ